MSADQLKGNEAEQEAPVNPDVPAEYGETEMNVNVEPADVPIEGDPSAGLEPGQMKKVILHYQIWDIVLVKYRVILIRKNILVKLDNSLQTCLLL